MSNEAGSAGCVKHGRADCTDCFVDFCSARSDWPAHLRDDAPYKQCDTCLRKSWATETRVGTPCLMPQPDGSVCEGRFREPLPAVKALEELIAWARGEML